MAVIVRRIALICTPTRLALRKTHSPRLAMRRIQWGGSKNFSLASSPPPLAHKIQSWSNFQTQSSVKCQTLHRIWRSHSVAQKKYSNYQGHPSVSTPPTVPDLQAGRRNFISRRNDHLPQHPPNDDDGDGVNSTSRCCLPRPPCFWCCCCCSESVRQLRSERPLDSQGIRTSSLSVWCVSVYVCLRPSDCVSASAQRQRRPCVLTREQSKLNRNN